MYFSDGLFCCYKPSAVTTCWPPDWRVSCRQSTNNNWFTKQPTSILWLRLHEPTRVQMIRPGPEADTGAQSFNEYGTRLCSTNRISAGVQSSRRPSSQNDGRNRREWRRQQNAEIPSYPAVDAVGTEKQVAPLIAFCNPGSMLLEGFVFLISLFWLLCFYMCMFCFFLFGFFPLQPENQ